MASIRCIFCADPITSVERYAVSPRKGNRAHAQCAGTEHTIITPPPAPVRPTPLPNIDREFCVLCEERISPPSAHPVEPRPPTAHPVPPRLEGVYTRPGESSRAQAKDRREEAEASRVSRLPGLSRPGTTLGGFPMERSSLGALWGRVGPCPWGLRLISGSGTKRDQAPTGQPLQGAQPYPAVPPRQTGRYLFRYHPAATGVPLPRTGGPEAPPNPQFGRRG